jgi:organic radical activating enzyme
MVKINIANYLLTRRCNLYCSYCRISGDINYKGKPSSYPDGNYFYHIEQPSKFWIELTTRLLKHNPNIFIILYGGEPLLYEGLTDIVKFFKDNGVNYTIISNCTPHAKSKLEEMLGKTGKIKGFTASIDPFVKKEENKDELWKSQLGLTALLSLLDRGLIEDPVAEITTDYKSIFWVKDLIEQLTGYGICSDLTVLDIAKNNYYDFSTITDPNLLVPKTPEVKKVFDDLINSTYNMHMKEHLLPEIYNILPAELDCNLKRNNLHNITIDSDGFLRLCLRIRGVEITQYNALDLLLPDGEPTIYRSHLEKAIEVDKEKVCEKCSWTCAIMSQMNYEEVLKHQ